ncbi:MATE family efflux transporter [Subtercola boreus]|uniref:MATE family efflux transporter n=1 Tax=Subtercola boreus TaxID=120213 RepID=A0A3E0WH51_9MICO|nr:MATE family efflux transporter [Subtercola boreus]RFA23471.1 MATE family efflux transporter [Subtercola boreus]RFA23864.1 MATE family efflux transporter [Subtercola boreus]RFA29565.1 MATE family efflux transporter [Subtercola boreus]
MPVPSLDRDILGLAVPALGALVAEPLFLLTDTALIGHLGEVPLAALSIASAIVQTVIGLLIFLAYATTPAVARRLGAGDRTGAIRAGVDGLWLALGLGVVVVLLGLLFARPVVGLFTADTAVASDAVTYLTVSLAGLPAMLLVIAATGLLRGLQDTRTPLVVAVAGFAANAGLNALFIYGFGWGIAGSAAGTVIAQWGMAAVYLVIAVRAARASGASLRPGLDGVGSAAASGAWLFVRTVSLRAAILATVAVAATLGVVELGAFQIALTLFTTLAFILDALAIAGQAMVGHGLGSGDVARVREVTRRLVLWGLAAGAVLGGLLALVAALGLLGPVFTSSSEVQRALGVTALAMAAGIPLAGYVFVLDGVLIGAGDARYLAISGLVNLAVYAPLLGLAVVLAPGGDAALVWLWAAFGYGYIGARALTLGLRARTERWMIAGAPA